MKAGMSRDQLPSRVLVVDDDETIGIMIAQWLRDAPVRTVKHEAVAEMAWAESLRGRYQLIILDWNLCSQLNGIALFNRWKNEKYYQDVPVLVISGYLSELDFTILDEYPIVSKMAKPLDKEALLQRVMILYKQSLWYTQQKKNIEVVFNAMNRPEFMDQVFQLVETSPSPFHLLCAAGNLLLKQEKFPEAEIMFKNALNHKKDSVTALNALGKIYLVMGKNEQAKKFITAAFKRSPQNIERLCILGDICLQELSPEKASVLFSKALEIDHENGRAKAGKKLSKEAETWMKEFSDIPTSFASLLNSIGISKARSGQYKECIEHYTHALKIVYDSQLKSKLSFNLGMGYTRWGKGNLAREWFKKAIDFDPDFRKAVMYLQKTEEDMQDSQEDFFAFETVNVPDPVSASTETVFLTGPDLDPGAGSTGPERATGSEEQPVSNELEAVAEAFSEQNTMDLSSYLFTYIGNKKIKCRLFRVSADLLEVISEKRIETDEKIVLRIQNRTFGVITDSSKPIKLNGNSCFFLRLTSLDEGINLQELIQSLPRAL